MNRVVAIAVCGLTLAGCSSMSSWMPSFELPKGSPPATTLQFESEPAGAEARTSQGQTCRTPCSMSVTASEFTVTFTQAGFQPQTVPVKISPSEAPDPGTGEVPSPRMVPNPVYVELQPAAPAPPRRAAPAPKKPRPAAKPAAARAAPAAPAAGAAPAPAPASPWPPAPPR